MSNPPHDPWSAGPPASENPDPTPPTAAPDHAAAPDDAAAPTDAAGTGADRSDSPTAANGPDDPTGTRATEATYARSAWPDDASHPDAPGDSPGVDPNATQIRPIQERDPSVSSSESPAWNPPPQAGTYRPPPPAYNQPGSNQPAYNQPGYAPPQPGSNQPSSNQPGSGQPGYGAPPAGYGQGYPAAGYGQPPGAYQGAATSAQTKAASRKRPLIIGLCALLVLALGTVGFLVLRPSSSPAFTFSGKKIANAEDVLTAAQSNTSKLVTSRHGASNSDTRCYLARATTPGQGVKKSDIDDHVYCGPVLFVDGDKAQTYLSYPISQTATKDGAATLSAGTTPTSADPQSPPSGKTLARPDKIAPKATSNLTLPTPPPAAAGAFSTTADVTDQTIPAAPTDAVIGSRTGGVSITNLGKISRYGHGDDARSAPAGQKLIAFKTGTGPDEDGNLRFPDGTIAVTAGGQSHSVPKTSSTVVIAVPDSASSADLVVTDAGATQRISLLTGRPSASNIAVARRRHHVGNIGGPKAVTFTVSAGPDKVSRRARASLTGSDLRYWVRVGDNRHASSPTTALLYVDLEYTYLEAIKKPFTAAASFGPYGFDPSLLKLHLPGGKVVAAGNYATSSDKLYILFAVPASFTSGTVVISGHQAPNRNGVTLGISGSTSFVVRVAAG